MNVGAPGKPSSLAVFPFVTARRSLVGSPLGGIRETQEVLGFCAEHHLGAETEVVLADQVDEARERVPAFDVRPRFVVDAGPSA